MGIHYHYADAVFSLLLMSIIDAFQHRFKYKYEILSGYSNIFVDTNGEPKESYDYQR